MSKKVNEFNITNDFFQMMKKNIFTFNLSSLQTNNIEKNFLTFEDSNDDNKKIILQKKEKNVLDYLKNDESIPPKVIEVLLSSSTNSRYILTGCDEFIQEFPNHRIVHLHLKKNKNNDKNIRMLDIDNGNIVVYYRNRTIRGKKHVTEGSFLKQFSRWLNYGPINDLNRMIEKFEILQKKLQNKSSSPSQDQKTQIKKFTNNYGTLSKITLNILNKIKEKTFDVTHYIKDLLLSERPLWEKIYYFSIFISVLIAIFSNEKYNNVIDNPSGQTFFQDFLQGYLKEGQDITLNLMEIVDKFETGGIGIGFNVFSTLLEKMNNFNFNLVPKISNIFNQVKQLVDTILSKPQY